jgi:hypothetical protein
MNVGLILGMDEPVTETLGHTQLRSKNLITGSVPLWLIRRNAFTPSHR